MVVRIACIMSCFCIVVVRLFLLTVLKSADGDVFVTIILLYLAISLTCLETRSAFFPFVGAFLHINQRLSSGIFSQFGSLSPNEAPGMSFCRYEELHSNTLSSIYVVLHNSIISNNVLPPVPYLSMF